MKSWQQYEHQKLVVDRMNFSDYSQKLEYRKSCFTYMQFFFQYYNEKGRGN